MNSPVQTARWDAEANSEICVCGLGARTSIGLGVEASAAAARSGISGLTLHSTFKDRANEPISFAADPSLENELPVERRMHVMLQSAIEEAVGEPLTSRAMKIDACWLAWPEPRAGLDAHMHGRLAASLADDLRLSPESIFVLQRGHAGGLMALQAAAQSLHRRDVDMALVVAVDSYHDRQILHSLDLRRRLMSAENRGGFPPGEAASACVLLRADSLVHRGLPRLARLRAAATALEPNTLKASTPCCGEGLSAVLSAVTQRLCSEGGLVTDSYCDLNGERYRNEEFVYALLRTQHAFVDANAYICPADCFGDVGAASGLLYLALAVTAQSRRYAKGDHAVLWAGSDDGYRSAVTVTSNPIERIQGAGR
jgi:3-oxoacyl-[acyl-carrier-protein] synthase I